jgi:hypothetical protein
MYSGRFWQGHNFKRCQKILSFINTTNNVDFSFDVMAVKQCCSLVDGHGCRAGVRYLANIENGNFGISFKFQFFSRSEKVAVKIGAFRFF